jgi:hypothetical protein
MEAFFVCIQESGSHIISEENPILTVSDGCHSWRQAQAGLQGWTCLDGQEAPTPGLSVVPDPFYHLN